ncbi:ATP-binding protein [Candidatus Dojkabacteria bacterium]|uniref:ATP-binding protein n=1 Tax=Candidatus Dojkabacteria bacterium TaxID=2099670 RepID=A0A955L374_9BACT|nr:ATP-binding protein [Candidatus Dojkabacteria bacterium]
MGNKFFRTFFALGYPRYVGPNWLEPLINFEYALDISTFYYPVDSKEVLNKLRRKIAEMEATVNADLEAGKIVDPKIKVALADARDLQEQLAKGTEKFFHFALYVTIHADTLKELEKISKSVESTLGAIGVIIKPATLQQDSGFESSIPTCTDKLYVTRNMDTTSLATTFPFVTSELTMDEGVMYGINKYNKSLVVFDRFQLENANATVFATSGAGKSYLIKIELLRSLMFGVEAIIIDPEREYAKLCETIGGAYISFSQDGENKLNPFELTGLFNSDEDELRSKILSLHGLIKVMIGGQVTSEEDAIIDRALILTYKEKGITPEPATHVNEPPLLEDMYKVLKGMAEPEAHSLASRLEKYIRGSAAGIFDKKSNIDINNTFTVFSIRDLSDELRPVAMYMMLEFIWTKIKKDRKKRILVVDEAWWMMQYPDAARFLFSIAKRARKYYLGLTTITQDVEDFLGSDYGKAIVTNSSIQILMKQSPAAVDKLQKVFYLSEGEKSYLLSCGVGEGLFFAGPNHVAIEVISSKNEHRIITSDPKDLERYEKERMEQVMRDDLQKEVLDEAKVLNTDLTQRDTDKVDPLDPKIASDEQPKFDSDGLNRNRNVFEDSNAPATNSDDSDDDMAEQVGVPPTDLSTAQLGENLAKSTVIPSSPNRGSVNNQFNNNPTQSVAQNQGVAINSDDNSQVPEVKTSEQSTVVTEELLNDDATKTDSSPAIPKVPEVPAQPEPNVVQVQSPVTTESVAVEEAGDKDLSPSDDVSVEEEVSEGEVDILDKISSQAKVLSASNDSSSTEPVKDMSISDNEKSLTQPNSDQNQITPNSTEEVVNEEALEDTLVELADDVEEKGEQDAVPQVPTSGSISDGMSGGNLENTDDVKVEDSSQNDDEVFNPSLAAKLNSILEEHSSTAGNLPEENHDEDNSDKDSNESKIDNQNSVQDSQNNDETLETDKKDLNQKSEDQVDQVQTSQSDLQSSGALNLDDSQGNLNINEERAGTIENNNDDDVNVGKNEEEDLKKLLEAEKKRQREEQNNPNSQDNVIPLKDDSKEGYDNNDSDVSPSIPSGTPFGGSKN